MGDYADLFNIGSAVGGALSRRKFNKQAGELEEEYAIAGGGRIDSSKIAEYEAKITALRRSTGMARRGMSDDVDYLKSFRDNELRKVNLEAGQHAAGGDFARSKTVQGQGMAGLGDVAGGSAQMRAGSENVITKALQNDPEGRNAAMGRIAAEHGATTDLDAANEKGKQFAYERVKQLLLMAKDSALSGDQLAGGLDAILKTPGLPFSGWGLREVAAENDTYQLTGPDGEARGAPMTREQVMEIANNFASDPGKMLDASQAANAAEMVKDKDAAREISIDGRKALTKVFADPAQTADMGKFYESKSTAEKSGWDLNGTMTATDDGGTIQRATFKGRLVDIRVPPQDPKAFKPDGPTPTIHDVANGNAIIDPSEFGAEGASSISEYKQASHRISGFFQADMQQRVMRANAISELHGWAGVRAGSGADQTESDPATATGKTSEPLRTAAQVQSFYEDVGKRHGFVVTSVNRTEAENKAVDGVKNSQHLTQRGTARDWSIKDQSPEKIKAFVAELEAGGAKVITKVHGTGPHIHAQWPAGVAPPGAPTAGAATAAAPATATPAIPKPVKPGGKGAATPKKGVNTARLGAKKAELATATAEREHLAGALAWVDQTYGKKQQQQGSGEAPIEVMTYGTPAQTAARKQLQQQLSTAMSTEARLVRALRGETATVKRGTLASSSNDIVNQALTRTPK